MNFPKHPYQPFPEAIPAPPIIGLGPVCLTFDAKWIPYLLGAISTLAVERTWKDDNERASGEAMNLLSLFAGALPCSNPAPGGTEVEDCMGCCLRVHEGHLQAFSCGVWADIEGGDLNALIGKTAGAPESSGPIPTDESVSNCVNVPADSFIPFGAAVGPGYTVEVTERRGQWSDGTDTIFEIFDWYCSNGAASLVGACAGVTHTESGDPLPTAPHMCLIARIEPDIILDLSNGPVVIPSHATGTVMQLQANDSVISDNQGTISACIKVTNSAGHSASLSLDTGSSATVSTPFTTVLGKTYRVRVSGRGVVGSGPTSFDAFYYDVSGSPVRATTSGSFCGFTNILQLTVDSHEFIPIPAFNVLDEYECILAGTGAPFGFVYCDSNYSDNHGTLSIEVTEM